MVVELFGNRVRITIMGHLAAQGPQTSGQIADALDLALPPVRRHLSALEQLGMVTVDQPRGDRRGTRPHYRVDREKVADVYDTLGEALGIVVARRSLSVDEIDARLAELRALLGRA